MTVVRSASETIFERFTESLADLIVSYTGSEANIISDFSDHLELEITSIVGLSSEEVSATVSLASSQEAALSLSTFPLACAHDWMGELANQLAGRLKNKLCAYGLQMNLSTPTTIQGNRLQLTSSALETFSVNAQFPMGGAIAQISLNVDPNLDLTEKPTESSSEEGSLELF